VSSERFVPDPARGDRPGCVGREAAFELRHVATPKGFEVHWRVVPMFQDV